MEVFLHEYHVLKTALSWWVLLVSRFKRGSHRNERTRISEEGNLFARFRQSIVLYVH